MDISPRPNFPFQSRLSFKPLIERWKQKINEGRKGASFFYKDIVAQVSKHPELMEPMDDHNLALQHPGLIEVMLSTIFPVTYDDSVDMYAAAIPFSFDFIFTSSAFKNAFLDASGNMRILPEEKSTSHIKQDKLEAAYRLILKKIYNVDISSSTHSIQPFTDAATGLTKYLELRLDMQFVDVHALQPLPDYDFGKDHGHVKDVLKIPHLTELLPLSMFMFEGMAVVSITDVTEREAIAQIKNKLLNIHSFTEASVFEFLQAEMQNLLGLRGIKIGLTPFFKVKNHYVFAEQYYENSILIKYQKTPAANTFLCNEVNKTFLNDLDFMALSDITPEVAADFPFMDCILEQGGKSMLFAPLKSDKELIGVLVVMSDQQGYLNSTHLAKIEQALPLFTLALEKSQENLDNEIDRVVKQQFTAVQSSVEWKFTEAALEYINKRQKGEEAKISNISFENVYPLYGAVDIRNSSVERNHAIQQDLLEQLNAASAVIVKAQKFISFPLLQEIRYRIDKYVYTVTNVLFSGDEITIHNFLKDEIVQLFRHLRQVVPDVKSDIDNYFGALDAHIEMLYHHRKEFEESISTINNKLAKFFDQKQIPAQKIFPHYFERFVTDGVDFNIYIGQSIAPNSNFDQFYLKNLKMWQLTTLAKAAQVTHALKDELSLPLSTTQLILAHSSPISISFRADERKFDVDGAYNIRYEIIKKRIDKVHLKDSNERLTQPGKVAIVYSQPREAAEYTEFIEFLQNQGLLTGEIEHLELEELQGVSGLKALRVAVNLEAAVTPALQPMAQKISTGKAE